MITGCLVTPPALHEEEGAVLAFHIFFQIMLFGFVIWVSLLSRHAWKESMGLSPPQSHYSSPTVLSV